MRAFTYQSHNCHKQVNMLPDAAMAITVCAHCASVLGFCLVTESQHARRPRDVDLAIRSALDCSAFCVCSDDDDGDNGRHEFVVGY